MRIKYNAPIVLTYALLSAVVLLLTHFLLPSLTDDWFMVPGKGFFNSHSAQSWVTLVTHAAGHADWTHLINNFALILMIGPILEATYGSISLFIMILITSLVTGALNVSFFKTSLMGASGVVFMMILLASFTNFKEGEIPLTFILILVLYLGRELFNSLSSNNISEFAHIVGGFCGSLFGFLNPPTPSIRKRIEQ
jgi:membrane associated rhomboid family serine protease